MKQAEIFLTSYNVPLESQAFFAILSGYVVAQMEQREDFLGKEEHIGTFRAQGWRGGTYPLVVAVNELRGLLSSAQAKGKAELIALLTQIALKIAQKWVMYGCFAVPLTLILSK